MIALLLLSFVSFVECDVAVGRIQSCSVTSFTGTAVVEVEGRYRACRISTGKAYECDGWFSGTAPAVGDDGRWHTCRISTGRVQSCDGVGYNGTVVAARPSG